MGSPVLPLNDRYTAQEVLYYLQDVRATLAILMEPTEWGGNGLQITELPDNFSPRSAVSIPNDIMSEELALLLYTSGTTGKPKGAMISHGNLLASIKGLHSAWEWTADDRLFHMLPLFHVHGLVVAQLGALYANAYTEWAPPKWDAEEVIQLWTKEHITICMMVPTIVYRLTSVDNVPALPHLRLCTSGSAPLPISIHQSFERTFGLQIVERYGMTEVGIVLSNLYNGERRPGTVGFALGDTQFRIVNPENEDLPDGEIGELLISGPSVIQGYWEQEDATSRTIKKGWLYSGDLAMRDSDGYYSIVGRLKDLIISGGFNVYPKEIERGLLTLKGVREVAVVGVPDLEWGESVVAVVIGEVLWTAVETWADTHLAPYKRPKRLVIVDDFPRNAMGKIQKGLIREMLLSEN